MKKEYIILLAAIVALSAYLSMRNTDGTHYTLPELKTIAAGDVDKMEVKAGADTLVFEKRGVDWSVDTEGFPAKKEAVENILKTAGGLSLTALVSEAGSYTRYDLGPDKAKTVALFKGEARLRSFSMGKAAPSGSHTFVTVDEDKNVYHAQGNFSGQFSTDPDRFIDKGILTFTAADVTALNLDLSGNILNLSRTMEAPEENGTPETVWKDETGNTLAPENVNQLLSVLSNLSCDKWLAEKPAEAPPALTLTVTTDRPFTLTLLAGSPMQGTASDKTFAFALSEASSENIMKAVTGLFDENPMDNARPAD